MKRISWLLILICSGATLGETEVPHSFEAGQPARAAEVNANFDALIESIESIDTEPPEITVLESRCMTYQEWGPLLWPNSSYIPSYDENNLLLYRVQVSDNQELAEVWPGNNVRGIENNDFAAKFALESRSIREYYSGVIRVFPNIKQIDYNVYIFPVVESNPYPFAHSGDTHMLILAKDSRGNIAKLAEQHAQECFDEKPAIAPD